MLQPVEVRALADHRLWLAYSDGSTGEVDLSDLAGRGIFALWDEPGVFEQVEITPWRAIAWSDDVELCADALYLRLTGKAVEDVFPKLVERVHA